MASNDTREAVEKFVKEILSSTQALTIYGKGHRLTNEAIDRLYARLVEALAKRKEITIGIIGSEIVFEKEPFYETSKDMSGLISRLKEMGVEKMTFLRGVNKSQLLDFASICVTNPKAISSSGGVEKALGALGIKDILLERIGFAKEGGEEDFLDALAAAKKDFQESVDFVKRTLDDMARDRKIDGRVARLFINKIVNSLFKNKYPLLILTSLKHRDEYTFVHAVNVAILTVAQAEALALEEEFLGDIGIAGLLHDAGKLALAADILKKKGRLDLDEVERVRLHPTDGAKILLETPEIPLLAAIAAFEHHVRYDMTGYPKRLYAKRISLASMMVAISDAYDAMRSKRPYHEGMTPEKVYEEMMNLSGGQFHPGLVDNFFRMTGLYPPGTLVELDTGEVALVVKGNALDIKRPQAEVLYDAAGSKVKEPYIVNLAERDASTGGYKRTITKSISLSDKYDLPDKYK